MDSFQLKPLSQAGITGAIEKAKQYRLLNEPGTAESICRDILAVDPDNQEALRVMVLALTDQFRASQRSVREAREHIMSLADEYDRAYFTGIVYEREARAYLERSTVRSAAYDGFRQAMEWYEKAEAHRPPGNVDAMLRWNSCARTIERERLEPEETSRELPLE